MNFVNDDIIAQLLKAAGTENDKLAILDYEIKNDVLKKGENCKSEISKIILRYEKNGERCVKSFFFKIMPKSPVIKNINPEKFFQNEVYTYEFVLPKFQALLTNESFAPRLCHTVDKNNLILEDLCEFGYRICDRKKQLDFEHIVEALKVLAKFHAVSVKFAETNSEISTAISEEMTNEYKSIIEIGRQEIEEGLLKVISNADPIYAYTSGEALSHFQKQFVSLILKECEPKPHSLKVLNHGGFCTSNILFKYDAYGFVQNVKFVDFQLCRWNSPALDIVYFIVNNVRYEIFEKYYDLLLEIYVSSFNKMLKHLKCDGVCEIDDLRERIENMSHFWIFVLITVTPVIQTSAERKHFFDENYLKEDYYIELSKKWISYFIKKGVLPPKVDETTVLVQTFVQKFEEENNVTVTKHEIEDNVVKPGNNFGSTILRLKIEYQNDAENISTSVFLKIPVLQLNGEQTGFSKVYDKEIYMFEVVLPRMYEFWNGKMISPKFYVATTLKSLVLEDLNESGFKALDNKVKLDLDHTKIALRTLAHFHGLSSKYLETYDLDKNKMERIKVFPEMMSKKYDQFLDTASTIFPERILQKLKYYKTNGYKGLNLEFTCNEDGRNFILHADYWISNMLFRYDEDGHVVESKMIDFQLCKVGSPPMDLMYFFISSVQFEVFEEYEEELLALYLKSLNDTLSFSKCNNRYTRDDYEKDKDKFIEIYVYMIGVLLRMFTTPEEYVLLVTKWIHYLDRKGFL